MVSFRIARRNGEVYKRRIIKMEKALKSFMNRNVAVITKMIVQNQMLTINGILVECGDNWIKIDRLTYQQVFFKENIFSVMTVPIVEEPKIKM